MTDIDRYRDAADRCAKMAGEAVSYDLRNIWMTVERSYRFLLEREERIAGTPTQCETASVVGLDS
jgi:hypothetical protein